MGPKLFLSPGKGKLAARFANARLPFSSLIIDQFEMLFEISINQTFEF